MGPGMYFMIGIAVAGLTVLAHYICKQASTEHKHNFRNADGLDYFGFSLVSFFVWPFTLCILIVFGIYYLPIFKDFRDGLGKDKTDD